MDDPPPGPLTSGSACSDGASAKQWARFIATRDPDLRGPLVETYMPLVRFLAERLRADLPQHIDLDDLISSGTFGLLKAIDTFDQAQGVKFETFATPRIRGAMLDELRSLDWTPRVLRIKAHQIDNAAAELGAQLGRTPSDQELAGHLGLGVEQLREIRQLACSPNTVSLTADCPYGTSGRDLRRIDILADARTPDPFWSLHRKEIRTIVGEAIGSLPRHERLVIILYYFEQLTMKQIGRVLDLSESRVCQIHAHIILWLQRRLLRWKEELLAARR